MKLKIREERLKRKWSIRKLSILSGVARGYISELENNIHVNPGIVVLCKLRKALGCTLDELVSYEGDKDGNKNLHSGRDSKDIKGE